MDSLIRNAVKNPENAHSPENRQITSPLRKGDGRFAKGESGNRGGRPKSDPKIKLAFSKLMPLALAAVEDALSYPDAVTRLKAAQVVFDRVLGKPVTSMDFGSDETTIAVNIIPKME